MSDDVWMGMRAVSDSFFDGDKISIPPGVLEHLGVEPRSFAEIMMRVTRHRDGRVTLILEGPAYFSKQHGSAQKGDADV